MISYYLWKCPIVKVHCCNFIFCKIWSPYDDSNYVAFYLIEVYLVTFYLLLHHAVPIGVKQSCIAKHKTILPECVYFTLKKRYSQFANFTTLTILTHLLTEYSQISDRAVQENNVQMKNDINGETDFEDLILQIEDAVENETTQHLYTDQQDMSIGSTIMERCGFYHEDKQDKDDKREAIRRRSEYQKKIMLHKVVAQMACVAKAKIAANKNSNITNSALMRCSTSLTTTTINYSTSSSSIRPVPVMGSIISSVSNTSDLSSISTSGSSTGSSSSHIFLVM